MRRRSKYTDLIPWPEPGDRLTKDDLEREAALEALQARDDRWITSALAKAGFRIGWHQGQDAMRARVLALVDLIGSQDMTPAAARQIREAVVDD